MPWKSKKILTSCHEPNATQPFNVQGCGVVTGYQNASRSTTLGSPGGHSLLDVPRPRSRWPCFSIGSPSMIVPTLCRHWSRKWFLWRFLISDSALCKEIVWFVQYIDHTTADTHPQPHAQKDTFHIYEHIYYTLKPETQANKYKDWNLTYNCIYVTDMQKA